MKTTEISPCRILPGFKPVFELLQFSPAKILKILYKKNLKDEGKLRQLSDREGIPLEIAEQGRLDSLCADFGHAVAHQGVIAFLKTMPPLSLNQMLDELPTSPLPILLALDQINDPGNLGTLARTAWALGAGGILLPEHGSVKAGPAAMKSSAGALGLVPLCVVANLAKALDFAEENGLAIYGTGMEQDHAKIPLLNAFSMSWQLPAVLILGNEAKGIRPGVQKRCQYLINIPFNRPFDSLNIAQAGAILLGLCAASQAASFA